MTKITTYSRTHTPDECCGPINAGITNEDGSPCLFIEINGEDRVFKVTCSPADTAGIMLIMLQSGAAGMAELRQRLS